MSSKRYIRHVWKKFQPINTWYFFAAFVVFLAVGIYAVRQNNLTAIALRAEVLAADKQNGDVESALNKLRIYMYSHMNANLSSGSIQQPIQLKYRYERLVEEQKQKSNSNTKSVYADAQKYCEARFPAGQLREQRVPCVQTYISERLGSTAATTQIPDALYKFDFYSPAWTPDLAGWSLLFAGVFLALFIIRILLERWFKAELEDL